jgi:hypothetical protein
MLFRGSLREVRASTRRKERAADRAVGPATRAKYAEAHITQFADEQPVG